MRLAFCLFKYFPYGGLQRDFLKIAKLCVERGHIVDVYTMEWHGKYEPGLAVRTLPSKARQNHNQRKDFVEQLQPYLSQGHYELIIGFNKMPGLDIYYAADTCYQAKARKQRGWWYRFTKRYKTTIAYEKAVFNKDSKATILLLSALQQNEFMHYYATPKNRFQLLPPGISRDRIAPSNANEIREKFRKELQLNDHQFLLLMVGSGFKTKGLDRTLLALASLPEIIRSRTQLMIIGEDNATPFLRQAKKLNISNKITFLGGREDVPQFLLAADLLIHPAYNENTGTVLLEAIVAGLPVLTTDVCGYARYIQEANAGKVIASPFLQQNLNEELIEMLLSKERSQWKLNALRFAQTADIYSLPEHAVNIIESLR